MTPTDAVVLMADGAAATAALRGWVPFAIIGGLIATFVAFISKGWKAAVPTFLGIALLSVYLYDTEALPTFGRMVLSFFGL